MMRRSIEGYLFDQVGAIVPFRGADGEIVEEFPQFRYRNSDGRPHNNYGHGPFCRFRAGQGRKESGVYIIASGETILTSRNTKTWRTGSVLTAMEVFHLPITSEAVRKRTVASIT